MDKVHYTEEEREKFRSFVESLKLVRKANLEDATTGEPLIDKLYTDLLPNNGIIDKVNQPNTTILVGRKGTGKSTIFQKSINSVIQKDETLCIYIDVKSLVDNTSLPPIYQTAQSIITNEDTRRYLTYVEFLKIIISKTKEKLSDKLSSKGIFDKVFGNDNVRFGKVIESLSSIENNTKEVFRKIDVTLLKYVQNVVSDENQFKVANTATISTTPSVQVDAEYNTSSAVKKEFQSIIATYLDIRSALINNIISIKRLLKIKYIYIYLDDFSEIDKEGQEFFIDWFVAPLNNLSEDFVKFKIATYPHRFHDGELDPSKVDTVNLDFFDAFYTSEYNTTNISRMQELALDYTKRLLEGRFNHYFKKMRWQKFFSIEEKELYEILFDISLNVTRKIGFVMSYCYESSIIHNQPITKESLKKAAERYYHDVTEKFFLSNAHIKRPFNDKVTIENQKGLLEQIVDNAVQLKKSKRKLQSHFVVNEELSYLLYNLELQGSVTIFNQVRDKKMKTLNVYALDYGLCVYNAIDYHKPTSYTQHEIGDVDIAGVITRYFNNTQAIRCTNGHDFGYDLLDKIKFINMCCPTCILEGKMAQCEIYTTDKQLLLKLKQMERMKDSDLINYTEFQVLDYLFVKKNPLPIKYISENVDLSSKTVENIIEGLIKRGYVEVDRDAASQIITKRFFQLTDAGKVFIGRILETSM